MAAASEAAGAAAEGAVSASAAPSVLPTEAPTAAQVSHAFGAANTLLLVVLLLLCVLVGYFLQERRFKYLPESGASMLLGAVAGGIVRLVAGDDETGELEMLQFSPLIFFFVLLPPIIFEAGYTLKKKRFFSNLVAIGLYAVVGTFISTFAVGFLTYLAALIGLIGVDSSSPLQSLLFGSLISSVDPVATLAILGSAETNCDPLLYSLVFGESVLNDAVAIVLFHVMNAYAEESRSFEGKDIFVVLLRFCAMTIASVCIGVFTGLLCSFVFKFSSLHKYHAYEIQMLFLFSFGCFALAELLHMSGVVALFFCALTLSHYNYYNLSVQTKISSRYVFESLAKTSETVVFTYMGVSIFTSKSSWDPIFLVLATGFCIAGRAANIFPMTYLANMCRNEKIGNRMQFFMFFSGLRGAVSYALSQQLSSATGSSRSIEVIQTTTLGITILTTFVLGGTTSHMLEKLDLRGSDGPSGGEGLREDFANYHELPAPRGSVSSADGDAEEDLSHLGPQATRMRMVRNKVDSFWRRIDDQYMKRLFGGKRHQRSRISPELFNAIQEGDISQFVVNGNGSVTRSNGGSAGGEFLLARRSSGADDDDVDGGRRSSLLINGASSREHYPAHGSSNGGDARNQGNAAPLQIGGGVDSRRRGLSDDRVFGDADDNDDDDELRIGHVDEDEHQLELLGMNDRSDEDYYEPPI
ncbi:Sodium/hydrogen exchanger [Hondaea fermentalgiana]|uniref:Sodium/hydrogen exchanger n=1 Tax=Hondaea fermentalgiana TaxID=2315210 RepID=A0A2R5GGJ5_9STRA|nr:Sodium/hydrogen exchanger [Hondaea fermentalgiana]|eukprot:GBG30026.1 Sodium/hydrogen exchanger [Hondaea fermentalgiana]